MEQPSAQTVSALRRSGLCEGLDDPEVERIAREGVLVSYRRGEQIFGEDSDANRLYLILRGVVRIETRPPRSDGAGLILDHLHPGRVMGEVGFIDEQPRSAAAVCEEDATLFTLTRADVDRLAESHPKAVSRLYRNLGRDLSQKLRDANDEMREVRSFTGGPDPELAELAARASQAQRLFLGYTQEQVNRIVDEVGEVILGQAEELAMLTVDETGMGCQPHKVEKIRFAVRAVRELLLETQTVGALHSSDDLLELLEPAGPICLVVSESNPAAGIAFHALLCLKTRNAAVIAFPGKAMRCAAETAKIVYDSALKAGAPEHWLSWIVGRTDHRRTLELVRRPEIRQVVVNGRPSLARSLASAAKPLLSDASGCTPCYVHSDADPSMAAAHIALSKGFDHGSAPTSEQVVLVHEDIISEVVGELALRGATFVGEEAREPLTALLFPTAPRDDAEAMVGRAALDVARLANLAVPPTTEILAVRLEDVSPAEPLAGPKFCPVIGFVQVNGEEEALRMAHQVLEHGGIGHTAVIHTRDDDLVERFASELPVLRLLVNCPATQGSWGGDGTGLPPSLTHGAGTAAFSHLGDNLGPQHLLQVRRVARYRAAPPAPNKAAPAKGGKRAPKKS